MTTDREGAFMEAVNEIKSISDELSRLKGAVQSHGRAADALGTASSEMEKLCVLLNGLPNGLSLHLDRATQFLANTEQAFAPAGRLASVLDEVLQLLPEMATKQGVESVVQHCSNESLRTGKVVQVAAAKTSEFIQAAMRDVDQGIKDGRDVLSDQLTELRGKLDVLTEKLTQADTVSKALGNAISQIDAKFTDQALLAAKRNADVEEKLSTLERLARRSLLAILMGKDAAQKSS